MPINVKFMIGMYVLKTTEEPINVAQMDDI